jgi:hypothetical protein
LAKKINKKKLMKRCKRVTTASIKNNLLKHDRKKNSFYYWGRGDFPGGRRKFDLKMKCCMRIG